MVVQECVKEYIFEFFRNITDSERMNLVHDHVKFDTIKLFDKKMKMGSLENIEKFKEVLKNEIDAVHKGISDTSEKNSKRFEKALEEKFDEDPDIRSIKARFELRAMSTEKSKIASENLEKKIVIKMKWF